ncbi:MAG: hypothetical protein ABI602_04160 [Candidatus Saccharibacteria bacterium]
MSKTAAVDQQNHIIDGPTAIETSREKEEKQAAVELSAPTKNGTPSMDVKVHSPFKSYYEGEAFSISGENETGAFDILPTHHNFITLLTPSELVIRSPRGDQKIQISGGIMHVKADKVIVFLDV